MSMLFVCLYVQSAAGLLAAHIPILNPSFLVVVNDPASDNVDIRKDSHESIQSSLASNIRDKHNPAFFHTVIQQHTNSHQSGTTTRHLRIQQQDFVVCGGPARCANARLEALARCDRFHSAKRRPIPFETNTT